MKWCTPKYWQSLNDTIIEQKIRSVLQYSIYKQTIARELERWQNIATEIECNRVAKWAKDFHISVGSGWKHPPFTHQNTKRMVSDSCEHLLVSSIWSTHWDHLQNVEPHSLWQRPGKIDYSSKFSAKNLEKKTQFNPSYDFLWIFISVGLDRSDADQQTHFEKAVVQIYPMVWSSRINKYSKTMKGLTCIGRWWPCHPPLHGKLGTRGLTNSSDASHT